MSQATCAFPECGQPFAGRSRQRYCSDKCQRRDNYRRNYSSPYLHIEDVPRSQAEIDAITDDVYGNGTKELVHEERTMRGYATYGAIGVKSRPRRLIR